MFKKSSGDDVLIRFERRIEINSSVKRIFEILKDGPNEAKWNSNVNESSKISSNKFLLKTNLGEMEANIVKTKQNETIIINTGGDFFKLIGYELNPKFVPLYFKGLLQIPSYGWFPMIQTKNLNKIEKKGTTEVLFWIDYDNEEDKDAIEETGFIILNSLKRYSEYLEQGHDPDDYIKQELLAISQF